MVHKEQLLKDLLSIKAVQINPTNYFTWTSGMKAPIYCDNRLTMSYPEIRKKITQLFLQQLDSLVEKPDIIAGCVTAGIPHAAWLANELNLPMVYVRSKRKKYGKANQIEGVYQKGQKVLIIEDLISTGGSSIHCAQALKEEGLNVLSIFAIFSYGLETADENFAKANLSYEAITNYDELLHILVDNNKMDTNIKKDLIHWRNALSNKKQ